MFLLNALRSWWNERRAPFSCALLTTALIATTAAVCLIAWQLTASNFNLLRVSSRQNAADSLDLSTSSQTPCFCDDNSLCKPLLWQEARGNDGRSQIVAFVLPCSSDVWLKFDWHRLTIIVLMGFFSEDLLCHAHRHRVRVLANADFKLLNVTSPAYRSNWTAQHIDYITGHFLDGLNVDFEEPIGAKAPARAAFVELMNSTTAALRKTNDAAVVMVDVPWSPHCVDGRCYDFVGLARVVDLLFVMGYDQRSQLTADQCVAGANAPLDIILAGVRNYTNGPPPNTSTNRVPPSQLVLGMPWYGYDYTCVNNVSAVGGRCDIEHRPFRGSACSDSVGRQRPYSQLQQWEQLPDTHTLWSNSSQTPYLQLQLADWKCIHQVWYDNMSSITYKVMGAASLNLAGMGMWAANFLDSSDTPAARQQRSEMWGTLLRWDTEQH